MGAGRSFNRPHLHQTKPIAGVGAGCSEQNGRLTTGRSSQPSRPVIVERAFAATSTGSRSSSLTGRLITVAREILSDQANQHQPRRSHSHSTVTVIQIDSCKEWCQLKSVYVDVAGCE